VVIEWFCEVGFSSSEDNDEHQDECEDAYDDV
jgi:hypothetical protein